MKPQAPAVRDLVLVGGGHSHVAVLKAFAMKPLPGARITLIARDVHTPYSGMLPGHIAGHYSLDACHIDLRPLANLARARIYHAAATGIDLDSRRVLCAGRPPVPYDAVSIDIGSAPPARDVPGAAEHAVPVKPIGRFVAHWEALAERARGRAGRTRIAVVGGGAGGVELALSVQHRLSRGAAPAGDIAITVVDAAATLLPAHNAATRRRFARILAERGIATMLGRAALRVEPGRLVLDGGGAVEADEILWVTGAAAARWPAAAGLDVDEGGFIRVDDCLRSISHPDVFACGDVAAVVGHDRPKAGVFAVRQGPPLAENLRRALTGRPLRRWRPQRAWLSLISTGDAYAVASRGRLAVSGRWVWRAKDWIDRRWMRKYTDLPEMAPEPAPAPAPGLPQLPDLDMRCGGCGAKVGPDVLAGIVAGLRPQPRDDVLIGLDDPDDAAVIAVPAGKSLVQTVDHFRSFVDDPYLFGRIAANHALGDIYAMGAEPRTALAIVTVAYGPEEKIAAEIADMMLGVTEVLAEAGAALVGGHTGEGAERALGLAVSGAVDPGRVLRKAGMRPGDRLLLTKPLGTGTLLAADMRCRARGEWIDRAIASMLQSNRAAAEILARHGARAATDVTGFGLAGHLVEMIRASSVGVVLAAGDLPVLDGAPDCLAAGFESSLQRPNARQARAIQGGGADALYPILFDPQTSGGLLASLPGERAAECLAALRDAGCAGAAIVGAVEPAGDAAAPIRVHPGTLSEIAEPAGPVQRVELSSAASV
ncbi:MAG: selenide, water dikinase SelD [Defluviicoccus sp.]|nr:selenide, water dikinase SelD [Defluviicoccus sp.]MDE0386147.1 selenide, water dikinase SelD [Defluviicoccus sp.]